MFYVYTLVKTCLLRIIPRPAVVQGHTRVTIYATGHRFNYHSRKLNVYYLIFSLWCSGKAWRWVPQLTMQYLHISTEGGEQTVFILGYSATCKIQRKANRKRRGQRKILDFQTKRKYYIFDFITLSRWSFRFNRLYLRCRVTSDTYNVSCVILNIYLFSRK